MFSGGKVVLILAPHTDDGEFGCGGTIAKLVRDGYRVVYAAFSAAEESVPKHLPHDILRAEVIEATSELGIDAEDCLTFNFKVRQFPELRQPILDQMIRLRQEYDPDIVFLPSVNDTHQDHVTIALEGFRSFKRATMLAYEIPWNNLNFTTSCFVHLDEECIQKKIDAISKYESQKGRSYSNPEFLRSLAISRGVQVGTTYAETFEVVRWMIR